MTRNIGIPRRPVLRSFVPVPRLWHHVLACVVTIVLAACAMWLVVALATPAEAQWRGHHRGGYHGGWQRQERRGGHDSFVGGIVGGIVGGAIGGMIANRPVYGPPPYDPVTYCMNRFRSYNPQTQHYFGFDGQYHRCP